MLRVASGCNGSFNVLHEPFICSVLHCLSVSMCTEMHLCYSLAIIWNGIHVPQLFVAAICDVMPVLVVCISLGQALRELL